MEEINQFLLLVIQIISALMVLVLGIGSMWLIVIYAKSVLDSKVIRVSTVVFGAIVLLMVGIGLREYPYYLMDMSTQGLNKLAVKAPDFRESVRSLAQQALGDVNIAIDDYEPPALTVSIDGTPITTQTPNPQNGGDIPETPDPELSPTAGIQPEATLTVIPSVTPTPNPHLTPMPTVENGKLNATPTLAPTATSTSVPTIDPKTWNPQTPAPTPESGG